MARYTKLYHSIWTDEDYRSLSTDAKVLYLLLISQPDITTCGVLPLTPRRWTKLLPDRNLAQMTKALKALVDGNFVVVDDDSEELWVRSYITHDGLHEVPNGRKAIERAMTEVVSTHLRTLIGTLYGTLRARDGERVEGLLSPSPTPTPTPSPSPHVSDEQFTLALDALVLMRTKAASPKNPRGYAKTVRANITAEDRERLAAIIERLGPDRAADAATAFEAGVGALGDVAEVF